MSLENKWPLIRDILAFVIGGYGVVIQLQAAVKDPVVLAFCAGLMGVPAMLGITKKTGT
jgi:hypothetical protein